MAAEARSIYRRFLRELPSRSPSILANPSPLQRHIRANFETPAESSPSLQHQAEKSQQRRLQEADQHVQFLKAQRNYLTLIERYNPGMNMQEEERVRLTARRVGMDLPIEAMEGGGGKKQD